MVKVKSFINFCKALHIAIITLFRNIYVCLCDNISILIFCHSVDLLNVRNTVKHIAFHHSLYFFNRICESVIFK